MNPAGRPKSKQSFGDLVRRCVDQRELLEYLLAVVRGQGVRMTLATDGSGRVTYAEATPPSYKERTQALKVLLEYGYEKAMVGGDAPQLSAGTGLDFGRLSPSELDEYGRILAKAVGADPDKLVPEAPRVTFEQLEAAAIEVGDSDEGGE